MVSLKTLSVKDQTPFNTCVFNSAVVQKEIDEKVILSVRSRVADRYREDGRLNVVFCSSDDDSDGRRLAATARARGLFRWSLDMGAAAHSMPRRLP
jgi:hypothetical protein